MDRSGKKANSGLLLVNNWCAENSLILNKEKSVFILFALSSSNKPEKITIKLHNNNCKKNNITDIFNSNCRYFSRVISGIIFDEHLKWKPHVEMVNNAYTEMFFIFKELRNILDNPGLKMVYFALVQSILMYGLIEWGSAFINVLEHLEPLRITQRMLIRDLMKNYYIIQNCSTNDLFIKLKILTLEQLYEKL